MSATSATSRSGVSHSNKLEDQGQSSMSAAPHQQLYVTLEILLENEAPPRFLTGTAGYLLPVSSTPPLTPSNSMLIISKGAALSLKYARAQDLPSYPSTGGVKLASAGAAASLADHNKKPFEHWTPSSIPAANTAATKAKDYEMEPLWHPELSKAGSKAAIIAQRDSAPVDIWKASETEQGSSAASSALHNNFSPPAITEREVSSDSHKKALLAATASMSSGRRRAESAPMKPQPTQGNSAWALKAAGSVHGRKPSDAPAPAPQKVDMLGGDPARIQNIARNNINRQMYTSNPPVAIEVEERNRRDTLRASAVAMAQKMYAIQQAQIDEAKGSRRSDSHFAAYTARQRAQSDAANQVVPEEAPRYENLEEAARKLAQERLSKLHDEHAEYRQYYGQQSSPKQSRLSMRRGRRTSNLQEEDSGSDEEQSRKIRSQMSIFQSKLAEVDGKKRQADRDALLAIAHKNVTARMNAIDEKVFSETGKTSPQQREIWERQARERAQRESDERMINVGKVHIGGGKYLEQSEIDAIARARLQPTLDDITEKAEKQRARDEEIRLEQERIKFKQEVEKSRLAQEKAEQKAAAGMCFTLYLRVSTNADLDREKAEAKAQRAEEKRVQQEHKDEERRLKTEQKAAERKARDEARAATDEEKRHRILPGFHSKGATGAGTAAAVEGAAHASDGTAGTMTLPEVEPGEITGDTVHDKVTVDAGEAAHVATIDDEDEAALKPTEESRDAEDVVLKDETHGHPYTAAQEPTSLTSPTSPTSPSKRDSKVKSWFKKFRSGSKAEHESETPALGGGESDPMATGRTAEPINSMEEEDKSESDSIRDVALAGRKSEAETDDMYGGSTQPEGRVSPIHDEPTSHQLVTGGTEPERSVSPVSDSSELSREPFVVAADVASSRYSADAGGSKRDSGMDQAGAVSDTEEEPRGRKGFRERFLKKVIPGRHKDEDTQRSATDTAPGSATSPIAEEATAHAPTTEPHANPDPHVLADTEEPSTDAMNPLTPTQTNGDDDDDDFEEARDTFDEQRLSPPPKLVEVNKVQAPRLVEVNSPSQKKTSESPAGRNSIGSGSRFTEEL
ncbi:Eisosome assembly protein [Exophiala xenobiotica]|uniref:Eisosome assembly protein n=1 Tax=Vermiconidia calcicola TaxID=1690605 RepID=A0AAV9QEY5_9PEZI|nr:Eisosome assembly protein [Exophiala xenobiotica]KAK5541472.1 Eisosome assembly protein [Chaetothyriales sp. CCFEE 6169]KAK5542208.1 Eisosome assembly protein [Vermiconidia calcicola]KAK5306763.1 Eisosome assembly protein [Exophiala xenobiotica]KAK5341258.1 Eisosome assembly protein [Exophiala xenobiotica]